MDARRKAGPPAGTGSCTRAPRRIFVAAFGDAGHAFPAIALARALAGRGHEVLLETWEEWREVVEAEGLAFTAAEEYVTFPPPSPEANGVPSAAQAALALVPMLEEGRFDVVVSDILTLAPTLAAEKVGLRRATLIPHVYPVHEPGLPFFAFGALAPRTALGRAMWRGALPLLVGGLKRGREDMNRTREEAGLAPIERFHGGISEDLVLVATFPELEYPRRWPPHVRVVGPLDFEMPYPDVELPEGEGPLVVVAPSTAQDPDRRLVRVALEALADEPVRVLATLNRRLGGEPWHDVPANAKVVDWVSYTQVFGAADLVVTHGGHGTIARALGAGAPLLCCPAVGDMAENGARVAWAGAGLMLPWRLTRPAAVRSAVRRVLSDPRFATRARAIAADADQGGTRASELIEAFAARSAA